MSLKIKHGGVQIYQQKQISKQNVNLLQGAAIIISQFITVDSFNATGRKSEFYREKSEKVKKVLHFSVLI